MRGRIDSQGTLFFAVTLESLIPKDHPLRAIKKKVDGELKSHSAAFTAAYSGTGRPSIPPEQLLKAMVLQALYSIRSENQLCEQIAYNFLYRWFLDMKPEDPVFDRTEFVHNRQRFHESGLVEKFFAGSVFASVQQEAASREHFSVDGTLIQAWASMKSVRPKS
ncbi:MAG: transposase, partial [Planctomycetes bacterium]|nr:transposase [Planctomycetota bacterium]